MSVCHHDAAQEQSLAKNLLLKARSDKYIAGPTTGHVGMDIAAPAASESFRKSCKIEGVPATPSTNAPKHTAFFVQDLTEQGWRLLTTHLQDCLACHWN